MDLDRFDRLTRSLSHLLSRRGLASAMGLAAIGIPDHAAAKRKNKKRKKKRKKLTRNALGCVDVGQACRGNSANCCSGICEGNRPKRGKKDRSRCVAHNEGGCQSGQDYCSAVQATCGEGGFCFRTTGKASFCGIPVLGGCFTCVTDSDCEDLGAGPGAACIVCAGCPNEFETACLPTAAV